MKIGELITLPNSNHGIKEAVITIFFKDPLDDLIGFEEYFNTHLTDLFDKHDEVRNFEFSFSINKKDTPPPKKEQFAGYKLYKLKGSQIQYYCQFVNENNRQFVSIHIREYITWKFFSSTSKSILDALSGLLKGKVSAFNLYYLDEFKVVSEILPKNRIFNESSNLLPSDFFKSENSFLVFNTEKVNDLGFNFFDKIELKVQNKVINLGHSTIMPLAYVVDFKDLKTNIEVWNQINWAHQNNKTLLRDVLSIETQDFIGLNKNLNS